MPNAPLLLPLPEFALGHHKPFQKVKIGIVGLNFGRSIIKELLDSPASEYFDLTALCDLDESCLRRAASNSDISLHRQLGDLLEDDNVEAVGLFTGPSGRAGLIQKIVETGRHVITTKPLEMNADAMLEVLRQARQLGCIVHCNSPSPVPSQDLAVIQQWIKAYDLGRPVGAHADAWVSYREKADGSWYDDPFRCPAAPIYRIGIYLINDLLRLWGPAEKVQLLQSRLSTGRPTSDNAQLSMIFRNQALATIYASFCVDDGDHYRNGLVLNYERGTIYRNTGPAWTVSARNHCQLALVQGDKNRPVVVAKEVVTSRSGEYQWEYFAKKIRGQVKSEELSPEEMVESIRVIEAMSRSESVSLSESPSVAISPL